MHLLIDEQTADRLVSGSVAPDDAPPGYARLASLVRAAQARGSADELVGEGAVAAMAAAIVSNTLIPAPVQTITAASSSRENRMLSKVLTAKVATAATVALFGLGTAAAAATGALPVQGSGGSAQGSTAALEISNSTVTPTGTPSGTGDQGQTSSGAPDSTAGNATSNTSGSTSGITAPMTGPANQHALFGLCTAFLAPQGTAVSGSVSDMASPHGGKYSSTAFRALIKEAGGSIGSTTGACTTFLQNMSSSSSSGSTSSGSSQPSDSSTVAGSGRPASPGYSGAHSRGGSAHASRYSHGHR
ncbi:MAG TPA: hypothetical protein VNF71_02995 [Acidimicrobiales bacterium]|nr:hypothetical protein [Acidimicrobiales bacterium]